MSHAKDQFFYFIAPPLGHSLLASGVAALVIVGLYLFSPFTFWSIFLLSHAAALIYVMWQGGQGFIQKLVGFILCLVWAMLQLSVVFIFALTI